MEYDVPPCDASITPRAQCVHVASSVQPLDFFDSQWKDGEGDSLVQLNFAAPHVHLGAISLRLEDALTNLTVCEVTVGNGVRYGGSDVAGDERNYLTGLRPCVWGDTDAPRFQRKHPMRSVAVYNATERLTGVMALWLMTTAEVRDQPACATEMRAAGCLAEPSASACLTCARAHRTKLYAAGCQDDMAIAMCHHVGDGRGEEGATSAA